MGKQGQIICLACVRPSVHFPVLGRGRGKEIRHNTEIIQEYLKHEDLGESLG